MRTAQYLTKERLRHLDSYKYSSVDKSFVSAYVLQPCAFMGLWQRCATLLPPWLAPNTVTLIGFSAIVINFLTVAVLSPDLESASRWMCLSFAIGLFFYQTMDALDGKQARATNTSSPLGECIDHGFDTLNTALSGLIQACALGLGSSWRTVLCVLLPCWTMYLSTWEEYHTGTLYLGYINGPTEGILIAVILFLIAAVHPLGPALWQTRASEHVKLPLIPQATCLSDLVLIMAVTLFLTAHAPFCLLNVAKLVKIRSNRALTSRNSVNLSDALSQLFPIAAFTVLLCAWVLSPYSSILVDHRLVEFALLVCFLYGQLSSKIIVAHLVKGPFPFSPALVFSLVPAAVGINLPAFGIYLFPPFEVLYLHVLTIIAFLSWFTSASMVVDAFCKHLRISAFTIPLVRLDQRRRSNTALREEGLARKTAQI
ncbi:hypothetical protein OIO90_003182 [Microbotryomycetes sp. JL221]|nr:hypothetical protein OIO90_003182 [Microbotryomycetes sp. JL221]